MKNLFKQNFSYYFLVLVITELIFVQCYPEGRMITKPLLLISLMAFYMLSSYRIDKIFLLGMFFAFLGDTFLLFEGYFLFGLGSFLVMQLLYAYCFFGQRGALTLYKTIGLVVIGFMAVGMLYDLVPRLPSEMILPVIVYTSSIALMSMAGVGMRSTGGHYRMIVLGVTSFLISDSLLGINMFGGGFKYANLLVMVTYVIAQYCIVKAYLTYEDGNNAEGKT